MQALTAGQRAENNRQWSDQAQTGHLYPSPPQGSGIVTVEETERLEESEIGEDQSARVSLGHDWTTAFINSHVTALPW